MTSLAAPPSPPSFNWTGAYIPQASTDADPSLDRVMMGIVIAFVLLASCAFCLQIILSLRAESRLVGATTLDAEQPTPFTFFHPHSLSPAQLNRLPIKVYFSPNKTSLPSSSSSSSTEGIQIIDAPPQNLVDGEESIRPQEAPPSCPVCLEDFKELEVLRELPCQHLFHRRCIDAWLTRSNLCPTCRNNSLRNVTPGPNGQYPRMFGSNPGAIGSNLLSPGDWLLS
ncbi:hypothetical protein BC830DRAFT_1105716 [Chytriomyces sp. MP71]|nr:hypothetical protein BC830DRAFT_1105716 [Chytriomyces sp. MP71]